MLENAVAVEVFDTLLVGLRWGGLSGVPSLDLTAALELVKVYGGDTLRDLAKVKALFLLWREQLKEEEGGLGNGSTNAFPDH